jgi:hypothetical protein
LESLFIVEGDLKVVQNKFGSVYYKIIGGLMVEPFINGGITITMGYFQAVSTSK